MKTLGLLGVAFVVLKLCGVIAWSWWFVLMPFYASIAIVFGLAIIPIAIVLAVVIMIAPVALIVSIIVLLGLLIWKFYKKGKK